MATEDQAKAALLSATCKNSGRADKSGWKSQSVSRALITVATASGPGSLTLWARRKGSSRDIASLILDKKTLRRYWLCGDLGQLVHGVEAGLQEAVFVALHLDGPQPLPHRGARRQG